VAFAVETLAEEEGAGVFWVVSPDHQEAGAVQSDRGGTGIGGRDLTRLEFSTARLPVRCEEPRFDIVVTVHPGDDEAAFVVHGSGGAVFAARLGGHLELAAGVARQHCRGQEER
jgi:hypothetical protein